MLVPAQQKLRGAVARQHGRQGLSRRSRRSNPGTNFGLPQTTPGQPGLDFPAEVGTPNWLIQLRLVSLEGDPNLKEFYDQAKRV